MNGPMLSPGVYVREEETQPRIPTQAATVVFCVGLAEMGPINEAVEIQDFEADFRQIFGGYKTWNRDTICAVKQAFDNGCQLMRFTRTVHHTDPADPATKTSAKATLTLATDTLLAGSGTVLSTNAAPYNLEPGDTIQVAVDGGGASTATFNAAAASRTAANSEPYALVNGQTLTVSIDGGAVQTITFNTAAFVDIGAATAAEVAAVINGQLVGGFADLDGGDPRIKSDKRGTSSGVNVTGGTANAALGFTTGNTAGTGNVQNIDAVSAAEVKTIVEAAAAGCTVTNEGGYQRISSNTTGGSSSIQVPSASTADDELGFDNAVHTGNAAGAQNTLRIDAKWDGTYAHDLTVKIAAPTDGVAGHFNLSVLRAGVEVEVFANLSMTDTDARYVETVVNATTTGSRLVAAVDLDASIGSPNDAPVAGTFGPLSGGSDGLTSLDDNDFIGGITNGAAVGLRTGDKHIPDVLMVPQRATPAMHNAMVTWCVTTMGGLTFPVLDPPAGYTDEEIETYFVTTAALRELSENGAFYWPRIRVGNPLKSVYGQENDVVAPPSGMVAGIMCRVDGAKVGGQFDQPAGPKELYMPRNVLGLETKLVNEKRVRDKLNPLGINCIRNINRGGPVFINGTNVLKSTGNWPSVGQKRGVMFVIRQLSDGLEANRHRGITRELIRDDKTIIENFLNEFVDAGSLASLKASEAYFVDSGPSMNKPSTARAKRTQHRIGLATAYPNEFTVVLIGPDRRAELAEAEERE
jgi:hypothetical protein